MDLIDVKFAQPDREALLRGLLAILPREAVLYEREEIKPYECDGLAVYRNLPMVVALPGTEEQVSAILKLCRDLNVPVVARGAGTGLSGGALPHGQGVLLSLAKFKRILSHRSARAHGPCAAGRAQRRDLRSGAQPYGLYYAPDPSRQIACTIGGNVAENSGGVHCLKYGLTVHNMLRVRGYHDRGRVARDRRRRARMRRATTCCALVTGSEGMLLRHHRSDGEAAAQADQGARGACRVRRRREGRQCGRGRDRGRHHPGRHGDDGQAGHAGRRGLRARGLRRSTPRRSCSSNPTARAEEVEDEIERIRRCSSGRRAGSCASPATRPSAAVLVRAQGGVPGRRPHLARLLLHGRHDPAQAAWRGAARRSRRWKRNTACAARTCSTPATATCIR